MSKTVKEKILDIYIKIVREKKMSPTRADLLKAGVNRDSYRNAWVTLEKLKEAARVKDPEAFKDMIDEKVFTPRAFKKLKQNVSKYKKFVITTAVTGMRAHTSFYKNLKYYAEKNDALLLILPSSDPATQGWELDGLLSQENVVFDDLKLNDSLYISTFKTSAKQVNPLTGIKRIGQREKSMIVASPKQFLEYVPIANGKIPHALMTTGAITVPSYRSTDRYMSQRTAYIAEFDHKLGAIVVEIKDKKLFHFTQIQAEYGTGFFIDKGIYYKVDKTEKVRPEAIVLGDIHVGQFDPAVKKATTEMVKLHKPKRVFLHDVFDGSSVNHHERHNLLSRAKKNRDDLSIEAELKLVVKELNEMEKSYPEVEEFVVVRSNHDDFLDRYLQSGEYIDDPINSKLCHELALSKIAGKNPFHAGLLKFGFNDAKFKFLTIDESYRIAGIELGQHGHLGLSGKRNPSMTSLEIAYGAGVFGHNHTAGILRDIYRVGTSTYLKMGYNVGPSSWTHTQCFVYSNGSRQLINIIDGQWK